jgi:hypothetical protein
VKKYCKLKIYSLEVYWYHLYMWFPSVVFRENYTQITTLSIFEDPERGHFRVNGCIFIENSNHNITKHRF